MKLSDYVADFLVKNGIDTMFMITGGGAMHLDDSLGHKEGLHCVYNHNEQGCSVAAEGYTRLTGKLRRYVSQADLVEPMQSPVYWAAG